MSARSKPCSCGCGRPRDQAGQNYRRDCATKYMRRYRARQKATSIKGLAGRVAALEAEDLAMVDAELVDQVLADVALIEGQLAGLYNRLAVIRRRWLDAHR